MGANMAVRIAFIALLASLISISAQAQVPVDVTLVLAVDNVHRVPEG